MFLKNWYSVLGALIMSDGTATANARLPIVDIFGVSKYAGHDTYNTVYLKGKAMYNACFPTSVSSNDMGVFFGDGSAEPSFNDFNLSGTRLLSADASGTAVVVSSVDDNNGAVSLTGTYTITNKRDTDITIREVGIVLPIKASATATASLTNSYIMVERSLLDTPVTIPAGGFGQVVYTVKMNLPTFPTA